MPKAAPKPCSKHPNVLVSKGKTCIYCETNERLKERARRKQRGPRVYDKASWRGDTGLRKQKLKANPLCECEECKALPFPKLANEVDHIDGNENNMQWSNLMSMHHDCHSKKTARENGGFGRG